MGSPRFVLVHRSLTTYGQKTFQQNIMGFPTKKTISTWGVKWGYIPPFKETPIYKKTGCCLSGPGTLVHFSQACS